MGKIVFCEDDPAIRQLIQVALRAAGHELHFAADGVAGLALIERERPDAVFTDVAMPGMTGLELSNELQSRPHLARIPIVILTASAQRVQVEEGYRHGAIDYLTKPFSPAELRTKVNAVAGPARGASVQHGPRGGDLSPPHPHHPLRRVPAGTRRRPDPGGAP